MLFWSMKCRIVMLTQLYVFQLQNHISPLCHYIIIKFWPPITCRDNIGCNICCITNSTLIPIFNKNDQYQLCQLANLIIGIPLVGHIFQKFVQKKSFRILWQKRIIAGTCRLTSKGCSWMCTYIAIEWPGKVHDARVFSNSAINHRGGERTLFPNWNKHVCHYVQVPSHG